MSAKPSLPSPERYAEILRGMRGYTDTTTTFGLRLGLTVGELRTIIDHASIAGRTCRWTFHHGFMQMNYYTTGCEKNAAVPTDMVSPYCPECRGNVVLNKLAEED